MEVYHKNIYVKKPRKNQIFERDRNKHNKKKFNNNYLPYNNDCFEASPKINKDSEIKAININYISNLTEKNQNLSHFNFKEKIFNSNIISKKNNDYSLSSKTNSEKNSFTEIISKSKEENINIQKNSNTFSSKKIKPKNHNKNSLNYELYNNQKNNNNQQFSQSYYSSSNNNFYYFNIIPKNIRNYYIHNNILIFNNQIQYINLYSLSHNNVIKGFNPYVFQEPFNNFLFSKKEHSLNDEINNFISAPQNDNTCILEIYLKLPKNQNLYFRLKRFDNLFETVQIFCQINELNSNLYFPIVINIMKALNSIFGIYNLKLNQKEINELEFFKEMYINSNYDSK